MLKRKRLSRGKSRRSFRKTAGHKRVHKANLRSGAFMRGGIRL